MLSLSMAVKRIPVLAVLLLSLAASFCYGQEPNKAGKDYVSLALAFNEFRSVNISLANSEGRVVDSLNAERAHTYGLMLSYGTYINDYFKTEWRAGTGIKDDTIERVLDVNLAYWLSWYFGFQYPITDYMSGYFMYGMSYYEADETRREVEYLVPGGQLELPSLQPVSPVNDRPIKGLFDPQFSTTWMLGLEFDLWQDWKLGLEYGRLIKDSGSNIKVRQAATHLRYEF